MCSIVFLKFVKIKFIIRTVIYTRVLILNNVLKVTLDIVNVFFFKRAAARA